MNTYCEYLKNICEENITKNSNSKVFFIYPSEPKHFSSTILTAVRNSQRYSSKRSWESWEQLPISGQIIFCTICKAIKQYDLIVADITTLNFNVLFEIGFSIGLNKPVLPIRDTSFSNDKALFDEIGIFDVLGYKTFENGAQIKSIVAEKCKDTSPIKFGTISVDKKKPVYFVKSPIETDGSIKIFSCLKKSAYRFRTFDKKESSRLSLHEAYRNVYSSLGIIAHLIDPKRQGALTHNGLCAFVCGMAMAMGKHVLMFQEGYNIAAIDYRDVIKPYKTCASIPNYMTSFVRSVADTFAEISDEDILLPTALLEKIDLGDSAAENEIQSLLSYFVKTPQYQQAIQGHARLLVGRKGSGKTAIFYAVRKQINSKRKTLVIDLKPEGHQFVKLRETVLQHLSEGYQLHTLTAFWNYLLLLEISKKIIDTYNPHESKESFESYENLKKEYYSHISNIDGDFSERIMELVNRIVEKFSSNKVKTLKNADITKMIFTRDIKELYNIVLKHLNAKQELWLLFDNIDKGWTSHGATEADISVVRCLLDATRKLQKTLERKKIIFQSIIFLRKDIYDLLIDQIPDRGKESVALVDWDDRLLLKELLKKRFQITEELSGDFEEIWARLFDPHFGGESSFRYILSRTFSHPREIINFVSKCIQIAISHAHTRVEEEDIKIAEKSFSEDMRKSLNYEIRDIFPQYSEILNIFIRQNVYLSKDDLDLLLYENKMPEIDFEKIIDTLLWFSFLGIKDGENIQYSYQVKYNMDKLKFFIKKSDSDNKCFVVHPAFNASLDLSTTS